MKINYKLILFPTIFILFSCINHRYKIIDETDGKYIKKRRYYFFTGSGYLQTRKSIHAYNICKDKEIKSITFQFNLGWRTLCTTSFGTICVRKVNYECG